MGRGSTLELVRFWRECPLNKPPFVHPRDRPVFERHQPELLNLPPTDFERFITSHHFGNKTNGDFHFSLLPRPYQGDLHRADIFLLQLNPGLNVSDYRSEYDWPEFRHMAERELRQDLDDVEFPFLWLNPRFCWSSGYRWWEGKIRQVARIIADDADASD